MAGPQGILLFLFKGVGTNRIELTCCLARSWRRSRGSIEWLAALRRSLLWQKRAEGSRWRLLGCMHAPFGWGPERERPELVHRRWCYHLCSLASACRLRPRNPRTWAWRIAPPCDPPAMTKNKKRRKKQKWGLDRPIAAFLRKKKSLAQSRLQASEKDRLLMWKCTGHWGKGDQQLRTFTTGIWPPNMRTTPIWRRTRKLSLMLLGSNSLKLSAQSPPCNKNALPRAASCSLSSKLRASPAKTRGGKFSSVFSTSCRSSALG